MWSIRILFCVFWTFWFILLYLLLFSCILLCCLNPSGRTMALGLTQSLNEMSTRNLYWGINFGPPTSRNPRGLSMPLHGLLYPSSCPLLSFISLLVVTLFSLDFIRFSPTLLCLLFSCSRFLWPFFSDMALIRQNINPELYGCGKEKLVLSI